MARPAVKITPLEIEKLGQLGATQPDIAAFFGVSTQTIESRLKRPEFRAALERGMGNLRLSLRRKQIQMAENGDRTMLIWLGKNLLGQRDQIGLGNPDGSKFAVDAVRQFIQSAEE